MKRLAKLAGLLFCMALLCALMVTSAWAEGEITVTVTSQEDLQSQLNGTAAELGDIVQLGNNIQVSQKLTVKGTHNLTLDLNGYTLSTDFEDDNSGDSLLYIASYSGALTICGTDSSSINTDAAYAIKTSGSFSGSLVLSSGNYRGAESAVCFSSPSGTLTVNGGSYTSSGDTIYIGSGNATITNGSFTTSGGNALSNYNGTVSLSGGTYYVGSINSVSNNTVQINALLCPGYAFYNLDDDSILPDTKSTTSSSVSLTVKPCTHLYDNSSACTVCDYAKPLTAIISYGDISEYRSSGFTYEQKSGYVFAGWFANAECTTAISPETVSGPAYAKYVDSAMLTVKWQIKADTEAGDSCTDLRCITSVDTLNYEKIGFDIVVNSGEPNCVSFSNKYTKTVYTTILENQNGDISTKTPSIFSNVSSYFMTFVITDFPSGHFRSPVIVTPKLVTLDGTTVAGTALTFHISDDDVFNK